MKQRQVNFADDTAGEFDAVIWATGYTTNHSWIDIPEATDEHGHLLHPRGVTPSPGLYTLGLTSQHTRGSALLGPPPPARVGQRRRACQIGCVSDVARLSESKDSEGIHAMTDTDVVPRKSDRPDGDPPLVDDQLADELLARAQAQGAELLGPNGLLSQVTKAVLERALGEELTEHLGYDKHDPAGRGSGNSRNGSTGKRLLTEIGGIDLDVPRDRNGSFSPQIVRKGQSRLDGFNDRSIALYARGMTTRDIRAHLRERYDVDVSPDLISRVTDAVVDELQEWQSRPLDRVYPMVFIDALMVKIRDGVVAGRCIWRSGSTVTALRTCLACGSGRPPASPRSSGSPCSPSSSPAGSPTCASSVATG
jgi:hypothetical protein